MTRTENVCYGNVNATITSTLMLTNNTLTVWKKKNNSIPSARWWRIERTTPSTRCQQAKWADLYTIYEIIHLMRLHKNLIKIVNQSNVRCTMNNWMERFECCVFTAWNIMKMAAKTDDRKSTLKFKSGCQHQRFKHKSDFTLTLNWICLQKLTLQLSISLSIWIVL